jgi:intein-encoded DNA endonuclease-like protein
LHRILCFRCIVYNTVMPIHKEFNKKFFKKWSYDMAYILGFIFADGNIIKTKRGTHFVAIYTADRELLVGMVQAFGSNHKISTCVYETGNVYKVQIGSKELFHDLVALGLTPNKAKRMRLPDIPKKYFSDFLRGYFDGDGNVWVGFLNKKRDNPTYVITTSFTSASKIFLSAVRTELKKIGINGGSMYDIKLKNCSRLSFSTLDSLKIYKIMYTISHRLFLSRKKLVFEKFVSMRP